MTMQYVDIAWTDLQREFHLARSQPRHLAPQPKAHLASLRAGLDGVVDSLLLLNTQSKCSGVLFLTALRVIASIGSPTASPKSSPSFANSTLQKNRQRLAGYVGLSEKGRSRPFLGLTAASRPA